MVDSGQPGFRERLRVPWWWHLVAVAVAIVIGLESAFLAASALGQGLVLAAFVLLAEVGLWRAGSGSVEISGGRLRAGSWRLPVSAVRAVAMLDREETREELRRGDPRVYRFTRGWVRSAVLLDVDDPDDLPLWLVSTRDPARLVDLLGAAILAAGPELAGPGPSDTGLEGPGRAAAGLPGPGPLEAATGPHVLDGVVVAREPGPVGPAEPEGPRPAR